MQETVRRTFVIKECGHGLYHLVVDDLPLLGLSRSPQRRQDTYNLEYTRHSLRGNFQAAVDAGWIADRTWVPGTIEENSVSVALNEPLIRAGGLRIAVHGSAGLAALLSGGLSEPRQTVGHGAVYGGKLI